MMKNKLLQSILVLSFLLVSCNKRNKGNLEYRVFVNSMQDLEIERVDHNSSVLSVNKFYEEISQKKLPVVIWVDTKKQFLKIDDFCNNVIIKGKKEGIPIKIQLPLGDLQMTDKLNPQANQ